MLKYSWYSFPVAQMVKNLLTMQETQVRSLGWEDPLEKGILAWRIPGTEELMDHSPWGCEESDMTKRLTHYFSS